LKEEEARVSGESQNVPTPYRDVTSRSLSIIKRQCRRRNRKSRAACRVYGLGKAKVGWL
jgi:hypothetical protein